jgi:hypothetical protein
MIRKVSMQSRALARVRLRNTLEFASAERALKSLFE